MAIELEEQDLENTDELLPKPPLFLFEPIGSEEEIKVEKDEDIEEIPEKDKWRLFHDLRQKKKKLIREANPYQNAKIPPPPLPMMRNLMMM